MNVSSKRCAIVIPAYSPEIAPDEYPSIRHLEHFLADRDIFVMAPTGLRVERLPYTYVAFAPEHFKSRDTYSKLLLSAEFYEAFSAYEYILIYQLDSLVFSSNLEQWLDTGYDYIGAPLFRDSAHPDSGFSRVGNGGFSLRKVQAFLDVIHSRRYANGSPSFAAELMSARLPDTERAGFAQRMKKNAQVLKAVRQGSEAYRMQYSLNEDLFWSDRAKLFHPSFSIAPVNVGISFAFEMHPRYCYAQNGNALPFGCHAWAKWDREFWSKHLLP